MHPALARVFRTLSEFFATPAAPGGHARGTGPLIRLRCQFYGTVQAVGFRFTSQGMAEQLRLTGWVHNEHDGSVLLEAQGPRDDVDQLLAQLSAHPGFSITSMRTEARPLKPQETSFDIHF